MPRQESVAPPAVVVHHPMVEGQADLGEPNYGTPLDVDGRGEVIQVFPAGSSKYGRKMEIHCDTSDGYSRNVTVHSSLEDYSTLYQENEESKEA